MDRDKLLQKIAEYDYDLNWSDRTFVIEYLVDDLYAKLSDEELREMAEELGLNPDTGEEVE